MNVLRKYAEIQIINDKCQKPPIPELPKTIKELNDLLKQQIKIIWESEPVDERGGEYHPGGVAITDLEMECPFCRMKFKGVRESGCFMNDVLPSTCPNCNFSTNVLNALMDLRKNKK